MASKASTLRGIVLISVIVVILATPLVLAFVPDEDGHLGITRVALARIRVSVSGEDGTLQFSPFAIDAIVRANRDTDCGGLPSILCIFCLTCAIDASRHFDSEEFDKSTKRLFDLKNQIITAITSSTPDQVEAWQKLGQALHTIQDFYAHSNWVELHRNNILDNLGSQETFPISSQPIAGGAATCPDEEGTLDPNLDVLTTGYFDASDLCSSGPPGAGKCRHGDFPINRVPPFSCRTGISKDRPERVGFDDASARAVDATEAFVNQIVNFPGDPSKGIPAVAGNATAIRALLGRKSGTIPTAKSTLGVVIDDTTSMTPVINQVKTSVLQIINNVVGTSLEPSQYLLVRFGDPDVGPAYLTNNADSFRSRINSLAVFDSGSNRDCPERSMSGLLMAIDAAQPGATLFLFTDDQAKDAFGADAVIAAANQRQIQVIFVLAPPNCNPGSSSRDPVYDRIAQATGGQVFALQTAEIGQSGALMSKLIAGDQALLLAASGSFPGATTMAFTPSSLSSPQGAQGEQGPPANLPEGTVVMNSELFLPRLANMGPSPNLVSSPQTFTVAVDSGAVSVTFSISVAVKGGITLSRPSGGQVLAGQAGVTINDLSTGQIITVNNPGAGNWRLQVGGAGLFSVLALTNSSTQFYRFEFVRLAGRPGHEGLFPIAGQPVDATNTVMATLFGSITTANFNLVSETGTVIQSVNLAKGDPNAGPDDFVGTLTLPAQPFRVQLAGMETNGAPFQRIFPTFFRKQSVEVTTASAVDTLRAGFTTTLSFTVRNLGAQNTFQIAVGDDRGFITRVSPTSGSLAANASGTVEVDLTVPASTPKGTSETVSIAATSTTDQSINNGTTQFLEVVNAPIISAGGIVNGANFTSRLLSIGSIASLFGTNLATGIFVADRLPLPTTLGGVSVLINNAAAPLYFVSPSQINFQIPWEVAGQSQVPVMVSANGVLGNSISLSGRAADPGIFSTNSQGTGQGAIVIATTGEVANTSRPARRGEYISIYCTGLGNVTNRPASGAAAPGDPLSTTLLGATVRIGGIAGNADFSGLSPGFVGLYQVNIQVPANAPTGNAVPVVLTVNGVNSNTVTIAVQ